MANQRATVEIARTEGTFFARALGLNSVNIGARAVAEASQNAVASFFAKPWFIPYTVVSDLSPCEACALGEVLISNGVVTPYGAAQIEGGLPFTIKPNNPTGALAPGQFYAVRMLDSAGGKDYRTNISTCSPEVLTCLDTYGLEPGNMIGPTLQGVNDLIGSPSDLFLAMGQYLDSGGNTSDTSRSLVVSPLWDICALAGFCPDNKLPDGGANAEISVAGFALIFLDGVQGNNVVAHLLGVFGCGSVGPPPGSEETGPFSVLVRLVRLPEE